MELNRGLRWPNAAEMARGLGLPVPAWQPTPERMPTAPARPKEERTKRMPVMTSGAPVTATPGVTVRSAVARPISVRRGTGLGLGCGWPRGPLPARGPDRGSGGPDRRPGSGRGHPDPGRGGHRDGRRPARWGRHRFSDLYPHSDARTDTHPDADRRADPHAGFIPHLHCPPYPCCNPNTRPDPPTGHRYGYSAYSTAADPTTAATAADRTAATTADRTAATATDRAAATPTNRAAAATTTTVSRRERARHFPEVPGTSGAYL